MTAFVLSAFALGSVAIVAIPWLVWLRVEGTDLRSLRRWGRLWARWSEPVEDRR